MNIVLAGMLFYFSASACRPQSSPSREPSRVRQLAYGKSGEWLFQGLTKMSLPKTRILSRKERPFEIPVDWAKQSLEQKNFPCLFDPRGVDYFTPSSVTTAILAGFMTKYYEGGSKLFDDYFGTTARTNHLTRKQREEINRNQSIFRERSMICYLSYDQAKVQIIYYPGKIQFKGGARNDMTHWLPATPQGIRNGTQTQYALIQNSQGLLGILNGTFDKIDNFVKWGPKGGIGAGGFGYNFSTPAAPQPEMATFALYENGRVALGTFRSLPAKKKIRAFVQNRFMVVENGRPAKDADPNAYCSFFDNIARSYLFTDYSGRIGYLWTLYTPANVLAPIAVKMGIQNMMLLDIHSPISCSITDPAGPLRYKNFRDYMDHSFDLVPNFFRLSPWKASLVWISRALNSGIQTHYPMEAFKLGSEDYFALFLKNSPEARGVQTPRLRSASGKIE